MPLLAGLAQRFLESRPICPVNQIMRMGSHTDLMVLPEFDRSMDNRVVDQ